MAVSNPPVGLDHPTTIPENFEQESESGAKTDTDGNDTPADGEQ